MKIASTAVAFVVMLVSHAAVADERAARKLFEQYIQLRSNFDPSVSELYSDGAEVYVYKRSPEGTERAKKLNGEQWKDFLVRNMPEAKAENDRSLFTEVTITKYDDGFKIRAKRYSYSNCYTDADYYMIVAPVGGDDLKIVEERTETRPLSNC